MNYFFPSGLDQVETSEPVSIRRPPQQALPGMTTESSTLTQRARYALPPQGPTSLAIYKAEGTAKNLTDEEILELVRDRHIPSHQLEKVCGDPERGVAIRYVYYFHEV